MKKITDKLFWVVALAVGTLFVMQQLGANEGVDAKQALGMAQQGALLLDVRQPEEYTAIHAPDAKLIPLGELPARMQEISAYKDKPIAVICRSGRRSAKAVELLREAGYSNVSNVAGGMQGWESDGLEVVRM
ncbi:MAG: rhodanese-like domain-containing protein [Gallionella sp.]|jgi:rhodanese-related sulfurtransferase|nr:rhodanese-like domain-containing protein [Gallionella sp.]MCK9355325.1 rhodanese-like domain-containing protein [Gallionella sp.]